MSPTTAPSYPLVLRHAGFIFNQSLQTGSGKASLQKKFQLLLAPSLLHSGRASNLGQGDLLIGVERRAAGLGTGTAQPSLPIWRAGRAPGLCLVVCLRREGAPTACRGSGTFWALLMSPPRPGLIGPGLPSPLGSVWAKWPNALYCRPGLCPALAQERGQVRPGYPTGRLSMCLGHWQ